MIIVCLSALLLFAGVEVGQYFMWKYYGDFSSRKNSYKLLRFVLKEPITCCLFAPVVEEVLFRVLFLGSLLGAKWWALLAAVILQAVLFGFAHTQYYIRGRLFITAQALGFALIFILAAKTSSIFNAFLLLTLLHIAKNSIALGALWIERNRRKKARLA